MNGASPYSIDWALEQELAMSALRGQHLTGRDERFLRVSGIGHCSRQLAYKMRDAREGRNTGKLHSAFQDSIFGTGHDHHLSLQQKFVKMGWCRGRLDLVDGEPRWKGNIEIPMQTGLVAGTCDGLTEPLRMIPSEGDEPPKIKVDPGHPDSRRYIVDIKTISSRPTVRTYYGKQKVYPSRFDELEEPKQENIDQATMYCWMTQQPGFSTPYENGPLQKAPDIMLVYVAKDLDRQYFEDHSGRFQHKLLQHPYKIFTRLYSPLRAAELLRKAQSIEDALQAGELPEREHQCSEERQDWQCRFCSYNEKCWPDLEVFREDPLPQHIMKVIN